MNPSKHNQPTNRLIGTFSRVYLKDFSLLLSLSLAHWATSFFIFAIRVVGRLELLNLSEDILSLQHFIETNETSPTTTTTRTEVVNKQQKSTRHPGIQLQHGVVVAVFKLAGSTADTYQSVYSYQNHQPEQIVDLNLRARA